MTNTAANREMECGRVLKQNEKLQKQLLKVKEQFAIAFEHWEMYQSEFVDVEREAFNKAKKLYDKL